jgi:hypothetical protein
MIKIGRQQESQMFSVSLLCNETQVEFRVKNVQN